jgi:Predicted nucleotide-binding protein containing TIR-like domain
MLKPRVFIASSTESWSIASALQANLDLFAEVTTWSQGVFTLSSNALDDLIRATSNFDFGIFILSPEDVIKIRDQQFLAIRDNVIFELGLFIGKLGKERNFLVVPLSHQDFHLPTDLLGTNVAKFNPVRSDDNLEAALGPASHHIRNAIQKMGLVKNSIEDQRLQLKGLTKAMRRVVELQQPDYSEILISDWKIIHSIDDKGNGYLHEEFTLIPATRPLYFYLMENSIAEGIDWQSSMTVSAENLTTQMPLMVVELKRSDIHVQSAVVLDPPSTVEDPQRISLNCERLALWKDLIEGGEDQGFLHSSNKSNFLRMEFLAPPGRKWKGFSFTPSIGTKETDLFEGRSRIIWNIPDPPARRYSYRLSLQ